MNDQHDDGGPAAGGSAAVGSGIDGEAMDWAIRMSDPDADWDAFMTWLEADATRAGDYDRAASALRDAEAAVTALPAAPVIADVHGVAANDVGPSPRHRPARTRRWVGTAIAAALVGVVGIGSLGLWNEVPRPYEVATAAGEQRTVALGDGSSIVLAGGSAVQLDRSDPRVATVDRGEVLFSVRHDADRPFSVAVGDLRLIDLGTVFDVKASAGRIRVAVAEGSVMVDPDGAAVRLDPGQAVVAQGSSLRRGIVDPADVGGWRNGRLAFDDASLTEVASDLSNQMGRPVRAGPAVAERTFRGTLDIRTLRDRPALLGTLLSVQVRQEGDGWVLEPGP